MPELPEVERARRLAETVALGRRISRVRCARDPIVFEGVPPAKFSRALTGHTITAAGRRGKYLWLQMAEAPSPLFHLGMTGAFHSPGVTPLALASSSKRRTDEPWPPRFTKFHLWLDDGGELVMTNKRRLGRIRLKDDPEHEPPVSRLGFDPLLDLPPPKKFREMLQKRSAIIKALLMDQSFAAGVGNWIADEVLYQAKIDPRRRAESLTDEEADHLRQRLRSVVAKAVAVNAEKHRFPKSWLFHHRWGRNAKAQTARGEKIEHLTVAGRTTAWVPTVQR